MTYTNDCINTMCLTYRSFCIGTLVILRLVLTTPGLSRQGSSKVGHRTSHLAALRAFVSRSQNTKISWLIIPKYIKIPCAKSIMASVHSHAMNLAEFHGTFGKTNWEKLGKSAVLKSSEVAPVPGPSPLLAGDFATLQRLLSDSVGSDARGPPGVSKISESRWDHGQLIDAQSNTLKNIENTQWWSIESMNNVQICAHMCNTSCDIHHERCLKYHPYSAGSHVCTELGLPGQRIAFSKDLHRSPHTHTEHGPWPMAHGPWPMAHGPWHKCDKRKNASLKFLEYLPCGLCLGVFHNTCLWDSILCPYACEIPSPSFTRNMNPNGKPNGWPNDFMISLVPGGLRFALSTLSTKICHLN